MPKQRSSKKDELARILALKKPPSIDPALRDELARELKPISSGYLRGLLRDSGFPLHPLVEGIRQDTWDNLERTLIAMGAEYGPALTSGDRERMRACRSLVIEAKQHARLAIRRAGDTPGLRKRKEEMVAWMLVWLENPGVFETWVRLRKQALLQEERAIGETAWQTPASA